MNRGYMNKTVLLVLAMALVPFSAFAVDGVVLINQSTVNAAGGFPYVISTPGSYKLSGNLQVTFGFDGIRIASSNVTLDLNGFSITSVDDSMAIFPAMVLTVGAVNGVTVRNGTISSHTAHTIDTLSASGSVLEDLTLLKVNGLAAAFAGSSAIVRRVSVPGANILITCPALVVDSLAAAFVRNPASPTCVFGFVSGPVF